MRKTMKKMTSLSRFHRAFVSAIVAALLPAQNVLALTQSQSVEAPLVRGPGITQEMLEAVAEADSRPTLADHLDLSRPGEENLNRLRDLLERAQSAWLSGSLKTAKRLFQDITGLTLKADWREPQREAIHYAHLRLAQLAPTTNEQNQWLKKAAQSFPDLQADPSLFPPPLLEKFRATRTAVLTSAKPFEPSSLFKNTRYLLVNGKRFALSPELSIRLPDATFRVTLLSDLHAPLTKIMHRSELENFQPILSDIANGTCQAPMGAELSSLNQIAVLYAVDCIRIRTGSQWIPHDTGSSESNLKAGNLHNHFIGEIRTNSESASPKRSRNWLWVGLAALAAGVVIVAAHEMSRGSGPTPEPIIKPVEREGY